MHTITERSFDNAVASLVRDEMSSWRAALHWALNECGDVVLGQRLVGRLNVVWQYVARVEGHRWIATALDLVDERTPPGALASLAHCSAIVAWQGREYKAALASCETAIAGYRAVGDSLGAARVQDIAACALSPLGRIAEAQALYQEDLVCVRGAGDQRIVAYTMSGLACGKACEGNLALARSYIADSMKMFDSLGSTLGVVHTLGVLAGIESDAGNAELALSDAMDALALCDGFDDLTATMDTRCDVARYLIALARYDEAEKVARETVVIARERHEDVYAIFSVQHLGEILALRPQSVAERSAKERSLAARLLGLSDARIVAMRSARQAADQLVYDRSMSVLRDVMGTDTMSSLMADGAAMTEDQAIEATLAL